MDTFGSDIFIFEENIAPETNANNGQRIQRGNQGPNMTERHPRPNTDNGKSQETFLEVVEIMPSLHLAYDELTAIVRCLNFHFRAISVRRSYDIVRFLGLVGSS